MLRQSPITNLHKLISLSPAYMSREKIHTLKQCCENNNITILFEDRDITPQVSPPNQGGHIITIGNPYLERLWSHTYFNICQSDRLWSAAQTINTQDRNTEYNNSEKHLDWALQRNGSWPIQFGCPREYDSLSNLVDMASEMFLCSCGFIIHHEISHVNDTDWCERTYEESRLEEQHADNSAFLRIIPNEFIEWKLKEKRCIGIVNWYVFLVSELIYHVQNNDVLNAGILGNTTHPRCTKRLRSFLNTFYQNESKEHQAASLVWIVLKFVLYKYNVKFHVEFTTNFDYALNILDFIDEWIDDMSEKKSLNK